MRSHSFSAAACAIACALLVSGCSSILIRPAADNVKTVALVSVYMNRDFYDVQNPRSSVSLRSLKSLGSALINGTEIPAKIDDPQNNEFDALIAYAIKAYNDRLENSGNLQWLPVTGVLSSDAYRKFADSSAGRSGGRLQKVAATLDDAEWYTAKDMVRIPVESVSGGGKFVSLNGEPDTRLALAQLCKDLNVDAVAILEFDMAFKKTVFNLDFFGGIPAVPSVSSALVLVNKDGEVAANSGPIVKGQGRRFDGKTVGMLHQDRVQLSEKSINSYRLAIDKSADDLQKRLIKEYGKIK